MIAIEDQLSQMNQMRYYITHNFSWQEALYLKTWEVHVFPRADFIIKNIKEMAKKAEEIRQIFNLPMIIHSWYRPKLYNHFIGGAKLSAHMEGKAIDFSMPGINCYKIKRKILDLNLLEKLDIRMEDNGDNSNWVHVDLRNPEGMRFFKP